MIGVVACQALYHEVEVRRPEATVRYVPQELHEFPMNVPREVDVQKRLQAAIDDLERRNDDVAGPVQHANLDRIVVLYANSSADVSGLRSTHAPVVVAGFDDCVSAVLDRTVSTSTGEAKEADTYYLTRGSIDCGVDGYKLHEAYRGDLDGLVARFEAARESHPDLRVTWPDGDLFSTVVERGLELSPELVGDVSHEILGNFERVELVDTGDLYDVHREYAKSFQAFVERLAAEHGDGHDVDLAVVQGDTALLERALSEESLETLASDEQFTINRPARSVE